MTVLAGSFARTAAHRIGWFARSVAGFLPFFRYTTTPDAVGVRIIGPDETRRELDELARREFSISGPEFVVALRAGQLPPSPALDHLALLVDVAKAR